MSEYSPAPDIESEARLSGLKELAGQYLDIDDVEFLDGIDDEEERLSYVYGRLLELGENPDEILQEFGVIEGDKE